MNIDFNLELIIDFLLFPLYIFFPRRLVSTSGQLVINSTSDLNTMVAIKGSESSVAIDPIIGGAIGGLVVLAGAVYVFKCRNSRTIDENRIEESKQNFESIVFIADNNLKKQRTVEKVSSNHNCLY